MVKVYGLVPLLKSQFASENGNGLQTHKNQKDMEIQVKEIVIGEDYHISGDLQNGHINGIPYICHEEITRPVKRVTETHIICACDRKF